MAFFYLDAHWQEDLPLKQETDVIFSSWRNFVIMIDDFRVPADPGYGYDNYGLGKSLELRDFPFHEDPRVKVYFPAVPSAEESGRKRGCIVLASASAASRFGSISFLRPYPTRD
jgi:hypothetical protein